MKQIKFIIYYLLILVIISGCKSTTCFVNKETGIKVKFQKEAIPIEPVSLENKYSDQFYRNVRNDFTFKWQETYQINSDVYIGMNLRMSTPPEPEKWSKDIIALKIQTSSIYEKETRIINNRDFLLLYYMRKENNEDYFVSFYSDLLIAPQVLGCIRFPASYPLERVKKETYDILSGIKFPKIKTE